MLNIKELPDEQILNGIQSGNYEIFTAVYSAYFHNLSLVSINYVKDPYLSEEIVQDVFIRIWENKAQLENVHSLKSYLYRAVINQSINFLNRQKNLEQHHLKIAAQMDDSYFDTLHEEQELKRIIFAEIERLPDQCKRVFKLSRFSDLKYREIALELNISERTVENHIAAALKILRSRLIIAGSGKGTDYRLKMLSILILM